MSFASTTQSWVFVTALACGCPQDEDIDSTVAAFVACIGRERSERMPQHFEFAATGFYGFDDASSDLLVNVCLVLHRCFPFGIGIGVLK
jgi:hypothetical protein